MSDGEENNQKEQKPTGSIRDQVKSALNKQAKDGLLTKLKELEFKKRETTKLVKNFDTEMEKLISEYEENSKL